MTLEIPDDYKFFIQPILDNFAVSMEIFTIEAIRNHINAYKIMLEHKVEASDEPHTYQFPSSETTGVENALKYYNIPYKLWASDVPPYLWNIDVYLNEEDFNYIRKIQSNHIMRFTMPGAIVDGINRYTPD